MKRLIALGILFCGVLLAGCGSGNPDEILQKMHDHYASSITNAVKERLVLPDRFSTTGDLRISHHALPSKLPAEGTITFHVLGTADYSEAQNPKIDQEVDVTVDEKIQSAPNQPSIPVQGDVAVHIRILNQKFFLQLAKLKLLAPVFLKTPLEWSGGASTKWYGDTVQTIDDAVQGLHSSGATTIQTFMRNPKEAYAKIPAAVGRFVSEVHLWKAVSMLPSQNGNYRIRVESDKDKMIRSLHAYFDTISSLESMPSAYAMKSKQDIDRSIDTLNRTLSEGGKITGILEVKQDDYAFAGFDGDMVEAHGKKDAHVHIETGDRHTVVSLTNPDDPQKGFSFEKTGEKLTMTVAQKAVMTGSYDGKTFHAEFFDGDGRTLAAIDAAIARADALGVSLTGTLSLPRQEVEITFSDLHSILSNGRKDFDFAVIGTAAYQHQTLLEFSITSTRKEVQSTDITEPATYSPLKQLGQDLSALFAPVTGGILPRH